MKKLFSFTILYCIICVIVNGQHSTNYYRIGYQWSHLTVHSPKFKIKPSGFGNIIDFSFGKKFNGVNHWQQVYNNPGFGIIIKYLDLGSPQRYLGEAFGLCPFYDFTFRSRKYYTNHFVISSGISYITKKFDPLNNPLQNAISTHWNNLTSIEWKIEFKSKKKIKYYTGIALTHISNGSFKSPNLGLNYLSLMIGIQRNATISKVESLTTIPKLKKNLFAINYGIAYREHKIPGGPKFKVYNLNVEYGRMYSSYKFIKFGIDAERHTLSAYFAERSELRPDISSAFNLSIRMHIFAGHEWEIGNTNIETRLGYQVLRNIVLPGVPLYAKLIFQYHIYVPRISNFKFSAGVCLKAQYGNAEYISAFFGMRYKL